MEHLGYRSLQALANSYLNRYIKQRPTFFDIAKTYPSLDGVTQAYPAIREELDRLLAETDDFPSYHDVDAGEREISQSTPRRWSVFMLEVLGHRLAINRARCPQTCRALERVPNLIQAFFSILDPGKIVPPHEGPYLGYLRYHLGLRVPPHDQARLTVNAQEYVWREGEAILFDDGWTHSVSNASTQTRSVLIVDVRRPLPPLPDLFNRFLTDVVARHTYGRAVARKAEAFARAQAARRQPPRILPTPG